MEFRRLLRVLRSRWRIIAATTGLAVAAAVVLAAVVVPIYVSSAQVFIATPTSHGIDDLNGRAEFAQSRMSTYVTLAGSTAAAKLAVDKLGIDLSPEEFASHITVASQSGTLVLTVTAQAPTAEEAQAWAQASAEVLNDYFASVESKGGVKTGARAVVWADASLPYKPISPNLGYNLVVAVLLGPLLGGALVLARESGGRPVRAPASLSEAVGSEVPLLGVLYDQRRGHHEPDASDLPLEDVLMRLQYSEIVALRRRTYAVAGPTPREDAVDIACRLAQTFARMGRRTLLIDADMRRGMLDQRFRIVHDIGLSTILGHGATLRKTAQTVGPNLEVVTCGRYPPNPVDLVESSEFAELIEQAERRYDAVVISVPPVLAVADALLVGARASGVILVVRQGSTKIPEFREAWERLSAVGARVAGVVLTHRPTWQRERGSTISARQQEAGDEKEPVSP